MRISRTTIFWLIAAFLAVYYLVLGIYVHDHGYFNKESLFYIEKTKIIIDGVGLRLQVMGLTAPLLPFYSSFLFAFAGKNYMLAPVFASAIGTAALYLVMTISLIKKKRDIYYLVLLTIIFLLHPGVLYIACSGKSTYLALIFFFLFFLNILRYYDSNTTFNVSIGSICLLILIFCDYKFIWISLFFVPLILSISIQTLNLGERESVFRLFLTFNNPSLRRKLINKTFAIYLIIFILPLATLWVYEMLNLTHANDLEYFIRSPYATWSVLSDKANYLLIKNTHVASETSILTSLKVLLFCPLMVLAIYLYSKKAYQLLTLLTPFALVEFIKLKYEQAYLPFGYYMIFLVLAFLCIIYKSREMEHNLWMKWAMFFLVLFQLYSGYYFLKNSVITEDRNFITCLFQKGVDETEDEDRQIAGYIDKLPGSPQVLMDDAISYPIAAFTSNIRSLVLPYQGSYLGAVEGPGSVNNYILVASAQNPLGAYSQLNLKYLQAIQQYDGSLHIHQVYETDNWLLFSISKD